MKIGKATVPVVLLIGLCGIWQPVVAQSDTTGQKQDTSKPGAKPALSPSPQVDPGCPTLVSVGISSSATTICSGVSVTFTATPVIDNFSGTVSYAWYLNEAPVSGSSSTYTSSSLTNGTTVSCIVTVTKSGCTTEQMSSGTITMTVTPNPGTPSAPSGNTAPCSGSAVEYTTLASNATSYNWSVSPSSAGTITGTGSVGDMTWSSGFSGTAVISVTGSGCGVTSTAATTSVTVAPSVGIASTPSGSTSICQGSTPLTYTTGAVSNATGYVWSISPSGAGTLSGSGTSDVVTWNSSFSGTATIGVVATGCNASTTPATKAITVQGTVGAVSSPAGPAVVSNNGTPTSYTATAPNATFYNWYILPADAGTIAGSGSTGVVTWSPLYAGSSVLIGVDANGCGGPTAVVTRGVTVYLPLGGGVATPGSLTIASGTDPGLLTAGGTSGGNCNGNYQYQWLQSSNGVTFSGAGGSSTGENYDPGMLTASTYFERRVVCGTDTAYTNAALITIGTLSNASNLNFVKTRTIVKPLVTDTVTADGLTSPYDVQQITQYLDGLGRSVQTVSRQITPKGNDLVQMQVYDPFSREAVHYLPYAATTADGNYKSTALSSLDSFNTTEYPGEQFYYGQTNFEASPLNRTLNEYAAGSSWVGGGRGVAVVEETNAPMDSVVIWNIAVAQGSLPIMGGFYPAGKLYKTTTADEAGHEVVEYKDKDGLVILKKVQLSGTPGTAHAGWLCTYYVYDNLDLLRFVIPPLAVNAINTGASWTVSSVVATGLCFRYEYDFRNRVIIKKVPGAGEVHQVYDLRDRLVMTQDSMLRANKQWLTTTYDTENRPDSTVLMNDPTNAGNLAFHTTAATQSPTYPPMANYTYTVQISNHYDDYAWVTALGSVLTATMDTSYNSNTTYFYTNYNSSPAYAVPLTPFMITRGEKTGTTDYILGTGTAEFDVDFYDDRGRTIEVQSTNVTSGLDKDITQYDFSGKALRHLLVTHKNGVNSMAHMFCNEYTYDAAFRLTGIKDNVDGGIAPVDSLEYDELGHLRAKYLGGGIDSLVYSYNIRNWVTGINKNYIAGTANDYFGMEIAYDKQTSVSTTTYAAAQYTGNITGLIWKSAGDQTNRKYDFTYDNTSRLTGANFLQNPTGSTWNTAAMDYSVDSLSYDANGNILHMDQKGFKIGSPTGFIDQLAYTYSTDSNQLLQVVDAQNDTASKLGDFHYKTLNAIEYTYDGNGNLKIDKNKGIDSIQYNYLNLPQYIHIKGKGLIQYTYTTEGEKQMKTVTDSTQSPVKVTTTKYIKNYQYTNDSLAQANFEEGRARFQKKYFLNGDSISRYFYDYFLKDHLGNTRVILTNQADTGQYIATMEAATRATENALFYNIDSTSYPTNLVPNSFPGDNASPNDSVAMVSGNTHPVGPAILLKVMDGDSISVGVNSYFVGTGSAGSTTSSIPNLLNTLANGLVTLGAGGGEQGTLATLGNASAGPVLTALNSFLPSNDSTPASTPKAYLNWMLLDNQFNYVSGNGQSGAIHVGTAGTEKTLATAIKMHHSGYLYIWVSNETQNWDVFFDNLSVQHFAGPMLEEDHYYPFGLTMAGISDKAVKTSYAENKYRFNQSTELQNKEFSDGTGLETYDATHRMYDPQIGRFFQIDLLPEFNVDLSPYCFANDEPISHVDPLGDTAWKVLQPTEVIAKKPLDSKNGQVLPSESWLGDAWEGHRSYRPYPQSLFIYTVDRKGYIIPGAPAVNKLEFDAPVGDKPLNLKGLLNLKNLIKGRYLIYTYTKGGLPYIGKAFGSLVARYGSLERVTALGITAIEGLEDLPNNMVALGVEQLVVDLNGGVESGTLANINNPTIKETYIIEARHWLDLNVPNWEHVLKFQ